MLRIGLCACIFCVAVTAFDPFGASSEAPAADGIFMNEMKLESAVTQHTSGTGERNTVADAEPAEKAAAPMEPGAEERAATTTSRTYNVVSIEVESIPAHEEYERYFISKEKIVPIIVALDRFYPVDENLQEPESAEGMAYKITVTYTNETVRYTLFGDWLGSDKDGWIRVDEKAAQETVKALSQESDAPATVSVSVQTAVNTWPLEDMDAQAVCAYFGEYDWIDARSRCKLDCKIVVNGKVYGYSSHCGVFRDDEYDRILKLEENDRLAFNEILDAYIPLESTEPVNVKVVCGSEELLLDASESAVIMDYLLSGQWIPTAANCLCDYTLYVTGGTYRYHSACGTIQNESGRSLTLSEEDKAIFDEIVVRCTMPSE